MLPCELTEHRLFHRRRQAVARAWWWRPRRSARPRRCRRCARPWRSGGGGMVVGEHPEREHHHQAEEAREENRRSASSGSAHRECGRPSERRRLAIVIAPPPPPSRFAGVHGFSHPTPSRGAPARLHGGGGEDRVLHASAGVAAAGEHDLSRQGRRRRGPTAGAAGGRRCVTLAVGGDREDARVWLVAEASRPPNTSTVEPTRRGGGVRERARGAARAW